MKGIFWGFNMGNVSCETRKKLAMDVFHLTAKEYDGIPDKFGLYICCENKKYNDYTGKITRQDLEDYDIIHMLSEGVIDKDKVSFWCNSIQHNKYLKFENDLL